MMAMLCAMGTTAIAATTTPNTDNTTENTNDSANDNPQRLRMGSTSLKGHILDATSGEHIPYVTVTIKGTTIGTVADATGHFTMRN